MRRFLAFILLFALMGSVFAEQPFADRKDVKQFINQMVKDHKFNKKKLTALFREVKIRPQVMTNINKPLEHNPWHTYQMLFVNEWRIKHGVEFWNQHASALKKAEAKYGVSPGIIIATLGVETKYGQRTGDYRVIDSLTNIAFSDSRRAPFFRKELEQFLLLTRENHLNPLKVTGSYAGAIGQPQFMPSSYRYYAASFTNKGKVDLMNNTDDVIASVANYYSKHGWKKNMPVASQAVVIGKRYEYLVKKNGLGKQFTVAELSRYGIVPKEKVSDDNTKVRVIELDGRYNSKEYWLGFHNFGVIRRYNPNDLYAMAVYQLSSYIEDLKERRTHAKS